MFEVLNVSNRTLAIGEVRLAPMQSHIFKNSEIGDSIKNKINSLSNLGLVKILNVPSVSEPEVSETVKVSEVTEVPDKRSNKKSK